ncbi:hypothetical protein OIE71_24680 [Streptomyces sp. NBC_01725]|uniref:hypothetical protein n=1 Tax=Streptomyces sp. NBC_01725 TaxID=2975923 RepID=UPI002E2A9CEC|nr:hypothetical protein [Streptomyces sp. NBC_01725]
MVGIVASIVAVLVEGEKIKWPKWAKEKKWWKALLVFVVVGAMSTGLTFGGYLIANGTGEAEKLGGVDLTGYCTSYNFAGAKGMGCESKIDLGDACDKRWNREGDSMKFTDPNDPNTGVCYTATGTNTQKGVDNLPQYCQQVYQLAPKVDAVSSPPRDWVCHTKIDPTLVCNWRYQSSDAVARMNADKKWECFEEKPL